MKNEKEGCQGEKEDILIERKDGGKGRLKNFVFSGSTSGAKMQMGLGPKNHFFGPGEAGLEKRGGGGKKRIWLLRSPESAQKKKGVGQRVSKPEVTNLTRKKTGETHWCQKKKNTGERWGDRANVIEGGGQPGLGPAHLGGGGKGKIEKGGGKKPG